MFKKNFLGSDNQLEYMSKRPPSWTCLHGSDWNAIKLHFQTSTRLSIDGLIVNIYIGSQSCGLHCDLPMISVIATQPDLPCFNPSYMWGQTVTKLPSRGAFYQVNATYFNVVPIPHSFCNPEQRLGNEKCTVLLFCPVCCRDIQLEE